MPLFELKCTNCNSRFESYRQKLGSPEPGEISCPQCGSKQTHKVFSTPNIGTNVGGGDPWNPDHFGRGNRRTLGDLWDEAAEKSTKREKESLSGTDPVLEKTLERHRRKKRLRLPIQQAGTRRRFADPVQTVKLPTR